MKKIEVIKNMYQVKENLIVLDFIDEEKLKKSFNHLLIVGDVWEWNEELEWFVCVKSNEWLGEISEMWWLFKDVKEYFKVLE